MRSQAEPGNEKIRAACNDFQSLPTSETASVVRPYLSFAPSADSTARHLLLESISRRRWLVPLDLNAILTRGTTILFSLEIVTFLQNGKKFGGVSRDVTFLSLCFLSLRGFFHLTSLRIASRMTENFRVQKLSTGNRSEVCAMNFPAGHYFIRLISGGALSSRLYQGGNSNASS